MIKVKEIYKTDDFSKVEKAKSDTTMVIAFDSSDSKLKGKDKAGNTFEVGTGTGLIKVKKVSLTPAQIKSLKTIPVLFVPKVAGKIIVPIALNVAYNFNTVAYADDRFIWVCYDGCTGGEQNFSKKGFLLSPVSIFRQVLQKEGTISKTLIENDLMITANNDTTLGDGTMDFYVSYYLIDAY